ncbi:MAG: hypothetical protein IPK74_29215 [Deltaproteobacteria bacterium]|nr:hypothetical protein [Deltaproteobacteria bacterium]
MSLAILLVAAWVGCSGASPGVEPPLQRPLAIDLEWNTAPSCAGADRVRQVIASLLARRIDLDPTGELRVRGDVTAADAQWRLELSIDGEHGVEQRELFAAECDALADAAALVVATSVDPRRVAEQLEAAHAEVPSPPRAEGPAPAAPPVADGSNVAASPPRSIAHMRARPRAHLELGALGGIALGWTPRASGAVLGDALVVIGRGAIGAQVAHVFERSGTAVVTARVRSTEIALRGCYVLTRRAWSVPLCGAVELGATAARGVGASVRPGRASALWLGAGLSTRLQWWPHPRVALAVGLDALVGLRRVQFHVDAAPRRVPVYGSAPVAARVTGGVIVRLGHIRRRR